jgi:hypothetical protein
VNTQTIHSNLNSLNTLTKETGSSNVKLWKDGSNAIVPVPASAAPNKVYHGFITWKTDMYGCTMYFLRFGSQRIVGEFETIVSFTLSTKKESIITGNQSEESSTGLVPCVEHKGCCRFPFSIKLKLFPRNVWKISCLSKKFQRRKLDWCVATTSRLPTTDMSSHQLQIFAKPRLEIRVRRMTWKGTHVK